jgi:hypothetical protein
MNLFSCVHEMAANTHFVSTDSKEQYSFIYYPVYDPLLSDHSWDMKMQLIAVRFEPGTQL